VESFRKVVAGCPVPVVIAGGPQNEFGPGHSGDVQGSIEAGGGVSIGRNVFQHRDPAHGRGDQHAGDEDSGVEEALSFLQAV